MISKSKGSELVLIPVIFILFSLGGAVFGMGEEAIPFAMLIIPIVIDMGYDSVTGIFNNIYFNSNRFCNFLDESI